MSLNVLSLFAGIGGLELGLERSGMTTVGQVEIDPFCRSVLARHWPEVPRHDDVRTTVEWWRSQRRPVVDVICGGFPCQPASSAGRRMAQADHRWLWPAMAAVIRDIRPQWIIGENVPGLLRRGLEDVVRDLRAAEYRVRVGTISACEVGAPHPRQRLFVLAHAEGRGCVKRGYQHRQRRLPPQACAAGSQVGRAAAQRPSWWETEPAVARVANGVPRGVDRIRALGNAVVPQVAEHIGRLIVDADAMAGAA